MARYAIHKQPTLTGKPHYIVVDYGHVDAPVQSSGKGVRPVEVGEFKTKALAQKWVDKQSKT